MKNISKILILLMVPLMAACGFDDGEEWTPVEPPASDSVERNEAPIDREINAAGVCKNEAGDVGWNQTGVIALRETGFGECADLRGVFINENNLRYPVLQGLNLAGANLEGAQFFFALLEDADLRGTQMRTIEFGYAWLSGKIDAYSRVTEECIVNETEWVCSA